MTIINKILNRALVLNRGLVDQALTWVDNIGAPKMWIFWNLMEPGGQPTLSETWV